MKRAVVKPEHDLLLEDQDTAAVVDLQEHVHPHHQHHLPRRTHTQVNQQYLLKNCICF